jgi:O-antigen/teichoic acid export membrane protein
MLKSIKSAAKGTIIYGLANVSVKLIGIILIPIYTNFKYLSKEDFGVLGVMDITYQLVIIAFGLALYQALARWYYDPEHRSSQKSMHFTVVVINASICIISFVFVYLFSGRVSVLLFESDKYSRLIWIMFAGSSVNIVSSVSMMLLRLQEKGVYEAALIGEIAGLIMISGDIVKNSILKFEYRKLARMLAYSFPLMLAAVSSVLLNTFDRYSLNFLSDLDSVGTYTLAFRIANSIKVVVITSIQLSLVPIFFKKLEDSDHKRFIAKSMNYSTFIVMLFVMFLPCSVWKSLKYSPQTFPIGKPQPLYPYFPFP